MKGLIIAALIAGGIFLGTKVAPLPAETSAPIVTYETPQPTWVYAEWEYSTEPPQVWLDNCITFAQSENLKAEALRRELNLKYPHLPPLPDQSLPPRTTCRDIWQSREVQEQWHTHPVYGKNGPKYAK
jgi:hypothetical protein